MRKFKYFWHIVYVSIILLLFIFNYFNSQSVVNDINSNGYTLIAKFNDYKKYPKVSSCYFKYYFNKKAKYFEESRAPNGFRYNIGKFYKVKYLPKYPDLIIVKFDKEVKDTAEILKAGFKIEDITH